MAERLLVFVSSVMRETEKEREVAVRVIKSLKVTIPWEFKFTPASPQPPDFCYLKAVEKCDIFVLILASDITRPVLQEYYHAVIWKKPILVFIKRSTKRSDELEDFINNLRIKYRQFIALQELKQALGDSVIQAIFDRLPPEDMRRVREISREQLASKILFNYTNADFTPLRPDSPRSPLELIKDMPRRDRLLPLMAEIPRISSIPKQIDFVQREKYAVWYTDSWVEREVQLKGVHLLKQISPYIKQFSDMYDAGCANCGQFKALMSIAEEIAPDFKYYGQDYNPDWQPGFNVENGEFFLTPLPLVEERRCSLVSCADVLQDLAENPIGIYASLFSFNKLLMRGGYCYITVPEKEIQPGMLDLLEKSATDAGFRTLSAGKYRLVHKLADQPPWNITTFLYLILQKRNDINSEIWNSLVGASFYRGGYLKYSQRYGINGEGDIPEEIRLLESDLEEMLREKNPYLRTFRHVLESVRRAQKNSGQTATAKECGSQIKQTIENIHEVLINAESEKRTLRLQSLYAEYLFWLAAWHLSKDYGADINRIRYQVYSMVQEIIKSSKDVRVHIDDLTCEQVARLMKHLFELCQFDGIDIRRFFEEKYG